MLQITVVGTSTNSGSKIPDAYSFQQPVSCLSKKYIWWNLRLNVHSWKMYILYNAMAVQKFLMKPNNELELCPQSKIF